MSDRLYHLAAWKEKNGRRLTQLREEPFCKFCMAAGVVTEATVADHVVRWREQPDPEDSFWTGQLQSLCQPHHNITKQQIEERGYHSLCDENGWPLDPNHPANWRGPRNSKAK